MNDNELRINNIVGRKYSNPNPKGTTIEIEPCFIKEIRSVNVNITLSLKDKSVLSKVSYGSIEPIELTEEWLIKFGFKYDDDEYEFMSLELLSGLKIHSDISDKFSICTLVLNRKMTIGIEYVHQLQNLYFALTGKELTI